MSSPAHVTVQQAALRILVPGFSAAWSNAHAAGSAVTLPGLDRALRRGSVEQRVREHPAWPAWQIFVLETLGLAPDARHAAAPLEWLGSEGEARAGAWVRADFVHVEVGTHAARLQPVEGLDLRAAELLRAALADHLAASGFAAVLPPRSPAPNHFFLHAAGELEAECPLPVFGATDVRERLPQGRDGARLRRLFTEAQMLLHEHPVNHARERARLRPINAIWLSGLGVFDGRLRFALPALLSDEPWVRGLAVLHDSVVRRVPDTAEALLETTDRGVVVLPIGAHADAGQALQALEAGWIAPLVTAIAKGRLHALQLWLDGLEICIDRPALRRFWRRGRSLSAWLS